MALLQSGTRIYGNALIDTSLSISGNTSTTSNATGALTVAGGIGVGGNIFSSGNVTAVGLLAVDAIFSGNLVVNGNTVYANVTTVNIKDPIIEQGGNPNGSPLSLDDGKDRGSLLHYYSSAPTDAFMGWKNADSEFVFASNASTSNNVITVNQLGNVRASTFIGTLSGAASTAGTVTTNAQPNITSVGTLTNLSVSGNTTSGNFVGTLANGNSNISIAASSDVTLTAGGTKPWRFSTDGNLYVPESGQIRAGSPFYGISIQDYNNDSFVAMDASGMFIQGNSLVRLKTNNGTEFDFTNGLANLGAANLLTTGNVTASNANLGNAVVANFFVGDGSLLTNLNISTASVGFANAANFAGTVTNADQPNITSVGTLTSLSVNGNVSLGNVGNLHVAGGSNSYVLSTDGTGNLSWVAQPSSSTITVDNFTGNGSQTVFTLSTTPSSINQTTVNYNGVTLLRAAYSLSGANITFGSAPADGALVEITTINLVAGTTCSSNGGSGTTTVVARMTWEIVSANTTTQANYGYFVDTSSTAIVMTLPSAATLGDTIRFNDLAGTFSTNSLTVARNGHKIQGIAENLVAQLGQASFGLVYSNSTYGWKLLEV